ncbi:hypothetical protein GcM3_179032 [Golovinomyces cichoracearum]|uniref:Uncharacterized protein n=1 Tax=Golovinomyces cichoracearum TaxID=62708 RepID=A0A420HN45_9PEZI|nr:hypothetical protein GcM3_179032 [Golovinomyces cichoracearum]
MGSDNEYRPESFLLLSRKNHEKWFRTFKFKAQSKGYFYVAETSKKSFAWVKLADRTVDNKKEKENTVTATASTAPSSDSEIDNLASRLEKMGGYWNVDKRKLIAADSTMKGIYPEKALFLILSKTLPSRYSSIIDGFRTNPLTTIEDRINILLEKEDSLKILEHAHSAHKNYRSRRVCDGDDHISRDCPFATEIKEFGVALRKKYEKNQRRLLGSKRSTMKNLVKPEIVTQKGRTKHRESSKMRLSKKGYNAHEIPVTTPTPSPIPLPISTPLSVNIPALKPDLDLNQEKSTESITDSIKKITSKKSKKKKKLELDHNVGRIKNSSTCENERKVKSLIKLDESVKVKIKDQSPTEIKSETKLIQTDSLTKSNEPEAEPMDLDLTSAVVPRYFFRQRKRKPSNRNELAEDRMMKRIRLALLAKIQDNINDEDNMEHSFLLFRHS